MSSSNPLNQKTEITHLENNQKEPDEIEIIKEMLIKYKMLIPRPSIKPLDDLKTDIQKY